jgi:hypothetical protein
MNQTTSSVDLPLRADSTGNGIAIAYPISTEATARANAITMSLRIIPA